MNISNPSYSKSNSISFWALIHAIFFLGVFFIPFNDYDGPSFLGEMKDEAAALFFILTFLLIAYNTLLTKKFYIPYKSFLFQLLILLFVWFAVSTFLNITNVLDYYYKQTSGPERFVRQYLSVILSGGVFFITYYNIFRRFDIKTLFYKLRRVFLYSLVVLSIYAFFEFLILKFNNGMAYVVLSYLDYLPFVENNFDYRLNRISSLTYEPPALATYLFSISGWMFSYILTDKGYKKYIPAVMVLILAFLSESRAGMIVILLQGFVFMLLLFDRKKYQLTLVRISGVLLIVIFAATILKGRTIYNYAEAKLTSFTISDDTHTTSNKSRFGMQYALYQTFLKYPFSGIGFGQQTFEAKDHYPGWAIYNNWEFRYYYMDQSNPSFPPGYNLYLRILAETGIIGFIIFLSLLLLILYSCWIAIRRNKELAPLYIAVFITMIGLYFNWLKVDTFRIFGFWINLAFLIHLLNKVKFKASSSSEEKKKITE